MVKDNSVLEFIKEKYPDILVFNFDPPLKIRFFNVEAYNSFVAKFNEYLKEVKVTNEI